MPRSRVTVGLLMAAAVLAGCSGDVDAAVVAAERDVAQAQQALTDAQAEAQRASAAFCASSASYITALDRYGDVLNATATTVGDVKVAGRDLERPQQAALDAGSATVEAQEAVTLAEEDLATAQARLDLLRVSPSAAGASPTTAASSPSASTSATATSSTAAPAVARVQKAEQEYATAVAGVTDATPLRTASSQVNAAVVALEFAWLALFDDAGCLTGEQQKQAASAVHDYTVALQQELTAAGYYTGEVDGVYGPSTVASVEALQKAHGLPVTGAVDAATEAALQADLAAKGGAVAQQTVASTAAVQQTLTLLGYWDGPVDGTWTPALSDALKKLQTDLGVEATGTVDAATLTAVEKAIAARETPSPVPTATVTVTATPSPTAASPTPSGSAAPTG